MTTNARLNKKTKTLKYDVAEQLRTPEEMAAYLDARNRTARVLLLGEAPSHRGCRFTGIAFCSETELTHKADLVAIPFSGKLSGATDAVVHHDGDVAAVWIDGIREWCRDRTGPAVPCPVAR